MTRSREDVADAVGLLLARATMRRLRQLLRASGGRPDDWVILMAGQAVVEAVRVYMTARPDRILAELDTWLQLEEEVS